MQSEDTHKSRTSQLEVNVSIDEKPNLVPELGTSGTNDAPVGAPDGGSRAWLVIVGTMFTAFSTLGFVNTWGVFQAYYEETILRDSTPSDIAWIGSVQFSLIFFPSLISGRLFDLGHFKVPFLMASILIVTATFLVAECTKYWHFLLCQGFAIGIGNGLTFSPTTSIVAHWFNKKRGLAMGLLAIGSSIGGTVFPITARRLINMVGFKWTMRILGFVLLVSLGIANLTLKRRLPPRKIKGGLFNWKMFKVAPYSLFCISGFFAFLGLFSLLTYIDISAVSVGIDPNFAFYLVSIANASSGFGRLLSGLLTDRFGAINLMAPMTLIAAGITYGWPFATSKLSFILIAIFYGFASGVYVSAFAIPLFSFGETQDVGRRVGMAITLVSAGVLAGPPISGAINKRDGNFKGVGYFAGTSVVVSVVFSLVVRQLVLKRLWGKF